MQTHFLIAEDNQNLFLSKVIVAEDIKKFYSENDNGSAHSGFYKGLLEG